MNFNKKMAQVTGGSCDTCQKRSLCRHFRRNKNIQIEQCTEYALENAKKVKMAVLKIRPQFNKSVETLLMFAIIEQAFKDHLHGNSQAGNFLRGKIPQAEICGVDSTWVTETLNKCGFGL